MTDEDRKVYMQLRAHVLAATARLHDRMSAMDLERCLIKQAEAARKLGKFEAEIKGLTCDGEM